MKIVLFALIALAMGILQFPTAAWADPSGIFPISSLDSSANDDDLAPLGDLLRSKEIVGMGEPIHGTHSPHAARLRMIKYLVEKENFRAIAFESPWFLAMRASEYVRTCQGSASKAIAALTFAAWHDVAVKNLLQWLCDFNQTHPRDPVFLFGADMQSPKDDKQYIVNFLGKADPALRSSFEDRILACMEVDPNQQPTKEQARVCQLATNDLRTIVTQRNAEFIQKTSKREVVWMHVALRSLAALQDVMYFYGVADYGGSYLARDEAMAWNFDTLRDLHAPGAKTIIYAHNYHIAKRTDHMVDYLSVKSMGTFLAEKYGNKYAAIGALSYITEVNQDIFKGWHATSPAPEGSLDFQLEGLNIPYLLVSTQGSFIRGGEDYIVGDLAFPSRIVPAEQYDLLFFSHQSEPLIPNLAKENQTFFPARR